MQRALYKVILAISIPVHKTMHTPPPTRAKSARAQKEFSAFSIHSLNDREFLIAVNDPSVDTTHVAAIIPIRKANIEAYTATNRINATTKDITNLRKFGSHATIVEHLYSLDDTTLSVVARDPAIMRAI